MFSTKSIATVSLLSQVITNKYQYALPLYRQESLFKQYGINLSRQTMASWMLKLTPLLMRLSQRYQQILLQQSVIHAVASPGNSFIMVFSQKTNINQQVQAYLLIKKRDKQ